MNTAGRVAVVAALAVLFGTTLLAWKHSSSAGKAAPQISLQLIDGRKLSLQELRGKTVLLKFWASDCSVCLKEMPALAKFYQQYQQHNFELIAVAMPYDPPDFVLRAVAAQRLPFPVALDLMSEAVSAFGGISVTPTAILIGPDGSIASRSSGPSNLQRLESFLHRQTVPAAG